MPAAGQTFAVSLELSGTGALQGFTSELSYDANVVEFVGVEAGPMLARQGTEGVVLTSHPGNVDVALLGTGVGLRGEGSIARAVFRVLRAGDARIALKSAEGRDAENRVLSLGEPVASAAIPTASSLSRAMPTPFRDQTTIEYALARTGRADLAIYTVQGRRVRTLAQGEQAAGLYRIAWDGRDERGGLAPAGIYYARLTTADGRFTRTLVRLQ
jgi:hypothetical protein